MLQKLLAESYTAYMEERSWIRTRNPKSFDCRLWISEIEKYEDNWKLVESRLKGLPDSPI